MNYILIRIILKYIICRLADKLRRNRAAITIQRYVRGWVKWSQYNKKKMLMINIQRYARGYLARKRFMAMKYNAMVMKSYTLHN